MVSIYIVQITCVDLPTRFSSFLRYKTVVLSKGEISSSSIEKIAIHYVINFLVVPSMTRSDAGTENGILASCQTYLRRNFFDNLAGEKSHVYGTSVLNQVVH